jgi:hypothetical protein
MLPYSFQRSFPAQPCPSIGHHFHAHWLSDPLPSLLQQQAYQAVLGTAMPNCQATLDHASLSILIAFVHPVHNNCAVSTMFINGLWRNSWLATNTVTSFPDYDNSVSGLTRLLLWVHTNFKTDCKLVELLTLPPTLSWPIACYIWVLFNMPKRAVSYGDGDPSISMP